MVGSTEAAHRFAGLAESSTQKSIAHTFTQEYWTIPGLEEKACLFILVGLSALFSKISSQSPVHKSHRIIYLLNPCISNTTTF